MSVANLDGLLIIYWGRRGGGAQLYFELQQSLRNASGSFFYSNRRDLIVPDYDNQKVDFDKQLIVGDIPRTNPFKVSTRKQIKNSLRAFIANNQIKRVISIMPSPFDEIAQSLCKELSIAYWQIVHDIRRHPGDLFPTKRYLKKIYKKCDGLIFLNAEILKEYPLRDEQMAVLSYLPSRKIPRVLNPEQGRILFIGRIRKYKGLQLLNSAWKLMEKDDLRLEIYGEGRLPRKMEQSIFVCNKWLPDSQIDTLIQKADLVVFPYIEASQSGVIARCMQYDAKIVITPIKSLMSQVSKYEKVTIASTVSPAAFAEAICSSLENSFSIKNVMEENKITTYSLVEALSLIVKSSNGQ
jgi:glycosyltransferase involved in cell wall biosynthesis